MNEDVAELVTFTSKEAYVYAPIPAATSYGHRAELWNPDKWLQEVVIKVVTGGDLAWIRLLEKESGNLFAECPLPHDGTPLTTAVEPVVDSSRYFVVKVVDRDSRNHAFIGIGFRDRMDSSDFSAALDDYRQYLRKKHEAELMRKEFDNLAVGQQADGSDATTAAAGGAPALDLSLKPGQTIKLNLSSSLRRTGSDRPASSSSAFQQEEQQQQQLPSLGKLHLLPPPGRATVSPGSFFKLQPPATTASATSLAPSSPAPSADSIADSFIIGSSAEAAVAEVSSIITPSTSGDRQQAMPALSVPGAQGQPSSKHGPGALVAAGGEAPTDADPAKAADDEWGDFVS